MQRLLHRHLQGLLLLLFRHQGIALILYSLFLLPGVALHEGSHWLAAKLLRVPTHGFSLIPRRTAARMIRFGYVETEQVDPIRGSLIGLAPLVAGAVSLHVLALDHLGLRMLGQRLAMGQWGDIVGAANSLLAIPDLLVWLYLVIAISNTMLPSRADRSAWLAAAIFGGALAVLAAALGALEGVLRLADPWFRSAAAGLAGVILVAGVVDLLLLIPLLLLELFLTRLLGWEIVY